MRKLFADMLYTCACNQDGARDAIELLRNYAAQGERTNG